MSYFFDEHGFPKVSSDIFSVHFSLVARTDTQCQKLGNHLNPKSDRLTLSFVAL